MDPITAISFASSIVAFVDFGLKIVTGTLEVVKSGSLMDNSNIAIIMTDFHAVVSSLGQNPLGTSAHELALKELAKKCQQVSKKLIELLDALKTSPDGSTWRGMKIALSSMRKKGEVTNLESQLEKYRSEIMTRLLLILKEGQLSIQIQLSGLQSQMQDRSTDATTQLQYLRNSILEKVELALQKTYQPARQGSYCDTEGYGCDGTFGTPEQNFSEPLRLVREVKASVDTLLQNRNGSPPEIRILKRVFFPSLYMRKDGMRPADVNTFEWIFKESDEESAQEQSTERYGGDARRKAVVANRLLNWLRNDNGVFHISGKAGSGKSTMVKLLLENQRTRQELDHWAGGKPLFFAHFFFWSSGDHLQQSLEGLYRSILFEILIQCPQLTREVFPSAYNAFTSRTADECIEDLFFTPQAFQDAFKRLIAIPSQTDNRICLLIDGLDEYGGGQDDYSGDDIDDLEHQYLAESLNTWASQDSIKILVSSRPHRAFEETFDKNLRIRLHELTRHDIVCTGRQMFERDKSFQRPEVEACYESLVEAVVKRSEGVFLWATLAIRDLLNCIKRYDRIDSLGKRLEGMPRNFNKLYEKMFNSIDIRDQNKALNLMLLIDAAASSRTTHHSSLTAVSITWLDDLENPEFPTTCAIEPYTTEEIEERQFEAECQLGSLTKGLVEIRETSGLHVYFSKSLLDSSTERCATLSAKAGISRNSLLKALTSPP